jgi:hypothetical protein
MREFQILACNILAVCGHRMMAEFLRIQGPSIALMALDRYTESSVTEHKILIGCCVLLLNKCATFSKIGKKILEDQVSIKYLLKLFETSDDDSTKTQVLRLLSIMCTGSIQAQSQLYEYGGVATLVRALYKYPVANKPIIGQICGIKCQGLTPTIGAPDTNTEEVSLLMIALLDAIWMSIVGNRRNEALFAETEGVDALLETLECSYFLQRAMILRVFADLLQNKKLMAFVNSWRSSRTMRSVSQLLAHAWMDEEVRRGVARDNGLICNIWNPLNGHSWAVDPKMKEMLRLKSPPRSAKPAVSAGNSLLSSIETSTIGNGSHPSIDATDENETNMRQSLVERLATAVIMNRKDTAGSRVPANLRNEAAERDMRGVITNIFNYLGVLEGDVVESGNNTDDRPSSPQRLVEHNETDSITSGSYGEAQNIGSLSPVDKQVLTIAKRYDTLREGEWWKIVFDTLRVSGVNPIDEDMKLIEQKLDAAFEAAVATQFEQMELQSLDIQQKVKIEDKFMGQILRQKNQQIKSEWLKKNAHKEKTKKLT